MKKAKTKQEHPEEQAVKIATPEEVEKFTGSNSETSEPPAAIGDDPPIEGGQGAETEQIDWKDKFLRAKADYQNLQKRSAQQQQTAVRYANADFARALLEVIDDLERTLQAGDDSPASASLLSGIQLVYEKLLKVLKDHNVELIEALAKPFDPCFHEAMMQEATANHPPNTVVREIQKGYLLRDRVLRPARVIVSRATEITDGEIAEQAEDP